MYVQSDQVIHHTGKPVASGIINIIVGSLCVLSALILGFGMLFFPLCCFLPLSDGDILNVPVLDIPRYLGIIAAYFTWKFGILGILSIIGGVFNLKRKRWGLALAGSIAVAVLTLWGVVSVIFTALSKDEFA